MVRGDELRCLRRCVQPAVEAPEAGDQPFGSVLVGADGTVLAEDRNRVAGGDRTRHPEFEPARWPAAHLNAGERPAATVYPSGEHCPMCAAAHAWVGLGRIVHITSSAQLTTRGRVGRPAGTGAATGRPRGRTRCDRGKPGAGAGHGDTRPPPPLPHTTRLNITPVRASRHRTPAPGRTRGPLPCPAPRPDNRPPEDASDAPQAPVRPPAVHEVAPGVTVESPVPELVTETRDLHRHFRTQHA